MFVTAPLGIFLGSGIGGKIDDGEQFKFNLQSCTQRACQAAIAVENDQLTELKKGERLLIGFKARAVVEIRPHLYSRCRIKQVCRGSGASIPASRNCLPPTSSVSPSMILGVPVISAAIVCPAKTARIKTSTILNIGTLKTKTYVHVHS